MQLSARQLGNSGRLVSLFMAQANCCTLEGIGGNCSNSRKLRFNGLVGSFSLIHVSTLLCASSCAHFFFVL
jgi:hypothetical protein